MLNENPELVLHACDYSSQAIEVVKVGIVHRSDQLMFSTLSQTNPLYSNPPHGRMHASVWDLSSTNSLPEDVAPGTVDIIVMIFVLSALHPNEWEVAIDNVHKVRTKLST